MAQQARNDQGVCRIGAYPRRTAADAARWPAIRPFLRRLGENQRNSRPVGRNSAKSPLIWRRGAGYRTSWICGRLRGIFRKHRRGVGGSRALLPVGSAANRRDSAIGRLLLPVQCLVSVPSFSIGPAGPSAAGQVAPHIGFGRPVLAAVSLVLVCAGRFWRWFRRPLGWGGFVSLNLFFRAGVGCGGFVCFFCLAFGLCCFPWSFCGGAKSAGAGKLRGRKVLLGK